MDETIYFKFKVQFDFALEEWFSIYALRKVNNFLSFRLGVHVSCVKGTV